MYTRGTLGTWGQTQLSITWTFFVSRDSREGLNGYSAGLSWKSRTTSAEWAARYLHTSVIDAAGAIYVIGGGSNGGVTYHDVWVSDGGARPDQWG